MQSLPNSDRAADARSSPRTNMFLAAVLHATGFSVPVKIRNLSPTGALTEGAAVPEVGAAVRLVRGSLMIPAQVVWSAEGRCGLRFSSVVSVKDWLSPPANQEQQRVDETVRLVKAGAIPIPLSHHCGETAEPTQLGQDLRSAASLIQTITDELANDEAVLSEHQDKLQNLDIALQTIAAVADILGSDAEERSTASRLNNLRASYTQALRAAARVGRP